ncbi:hypothetical protein D3C80_1265780 [compost metagenome]
MFEEHSSSFSSPYLFNGKELDRETNLSYFGARYYDAKTSLWLNVDPLALYNPIFEEEFYFDGQHNGGIYNSGNLNPYIYCYQNPILFVDPNGKQAVAGAIIGGALGAFTEYLGIIGAKMMDGEDFWTANTNLDLGDGIDIVVGAAFGAAEGTIDNGIGALKRWVTKPRNLKILKFVLNVGIDMLESGLKDVLKGTEYEKVDFSHIMELFAGSLTEVSVGTVLKSTKYAKKAEKAAEDIVKAIAEKSVSKKTAKATAKHIKKQDAIIKSSKEAIKKNTKKDFKLNSMGGGTAKALGNYAQDKVSEK